MASQHTQQLTGKERVHRALERRDHDRVPRYDSYWPETIREWESQGLKGGADGALEALGSDMQIISWYWPAVFPGQQTVVEENEHTRVVRDQHGGLLRFWKNKSGTPEHLGWECDSPEKWYQEFRDKLLNQPPAIDLEKARDAFSRGRRRDRWTFFAGVEPFECLRALLGDEVSLMAMIEEPEWIEDIARITTDTTIRNYEVACAAGIHPDGLWTYGDMAYNHATHCSPAIYRELVWPHHKRLAEWAHAHGMKFIFHTDGDVNAVIDDYILAGFDALQPLECKANMDVRRLCPKFGSRLSFFGNIDATVLISNDLERIEAEIADKFAAGKSTRGYIYHSDHSVPPQVSWATYQGVIQLVERHGWYD